MCTSFTEKTMWAPLVIAGKTHDSNGTVHWERVEAQCGHAAVALTEEIADLQTDVIGAMEDVGYGARDTFAVRLALEEAVINAVKHGHGNDPRKRARICWVVSVSAFKLVVEDDGAGFDPDRVPDPFLPQNQEPASGRGVFLMRSYMSWVRFNDAGNRVVMCRYPSPGGSCA